MGEVIISFKIYPKGVETNLENLENKIERSLPSQARLSKSRIEPIAFGLNALILDIVVPEKEGMVDSIEDIIKSNEDVENFEVISQRRAFRFQVL
ncbi:MAG: elongation factor 1-beta [Thermoproteota archaeon]